MLDLPIAKAPPGSAKTKVAPLFKDRPRDRQAPIGRARRIALIGTFAPRKCGIATFTTDIFEQLSCHRPDIDIDVYVLDDREAPLDRERTAGTIIADDPDAYRRAARSINESDVDAVWLQHEYGIYGGPHGDMVCDFVDHLAPPLILTLHTVLPEPYDEQRAILQHLVTRASRIMVMSQRSRDVLIRHYDAAANIVEVIEHGAPDRPFGRQTQFKSKLGLADRKVLMTFGLLGRGKGLEHVIKALPQIVERHPEILYRIVGATHPKLMASEGEAYREQLIELAERLGVSAHIAWDNRFLETEELLDQLEATDIYLTPYDNLQQSTSGTLSYAVALGKAVISTPYVHACELLADNVGVIIDRPSASTIADAVNALLDDPERLAAMQRRAYDKGRTTIWPEFAAASADLIDGAVGSGVHASIAADRIPSLSGVLAMSDRTGMLQHATGIIPDRNHGYCLDDNARALMLMNVARDVDRRRRLRQSMVYAAFVEHAWNPDRRRFRNFMRFDRSWCEEEGSEDSHGRAVWALGQTIETTSDRDLREWAAGLYDRVLPSVTHLGSPRAIAFAALGIAAVLRRAPDHATSRHHAETLAQTLLALLDSDRAPDWPWFEIVLGYDNPRLCQALIEIGETVEDGSAVAVGLKMLAWINQMQCATSGIFRPIGSESFGRPYEALPFDQQPLEAQAAIEAARAAYRITGEARWKDHAMAAWNWFFGINDRGVPLADPTSGRCRDGLTPRGVNRNCGAESILAYQLSFYAMKDMAMSEIPDRERYACTADGH